MLTADQSREQQRSNAERGVHPPRQPMKFGTETGLNKSRTNRMTTSHGFQGTSFTQDGVNTTPSATAQFQRLRTPTRARPFLHAVFHFLRGPRTSSLCVVKKSPLESQRFASIGLPELTHSCAARTPWTRTPLLISTLTTTKSQSEIAETRQRTPACEARLVILLNKHSPTGYQANKQFDDVTFPHFYVDTG